MVSFALPRPPQLQEQQYLSSIRHEKDAFERIIATKRTMALPADQDGRRGIRQTEERQLKMRINATRASARASVSSTRRGGGRAVAAGAPRPRVRRRGGGGDAWWWW